MGDDEGTQKRSPVSACTVATCLIVCTLLVLSTLLLADGCGYTDYGEEHTTQCDAGAAVSALNTRWLLVLLVALACVLLITLDRLLEYTGLGKCCLREKICGRCEAGGATSMSLLLVLAAATTAYAHYFEKMLDSVHPDNVSNPTACYVCPNSTDALYHAVLQASVAAAWSALVVAGLIWYLSDTDDDDDGAPQKSMKEMLVLATSGEDDI